jgi:hypothetical protein
VSERGSEVRRLRAMLSAQLQPLNAVLVLKYLTSGTKISNFCEQQGGPESHALRPAAFAHAENAVLVLKYLTSGPKNI